MQRATVIALAAALGLAGACKGKSKEAKPAAGSAETGPATPKERPRPPKQRPATEPDLGYEERRKLLLERGNPELMKAQEPIDYTAPTVRPQDLIKPIDANNVQIGTIKLNLTTGRAEIPAKVASPSAPLEYVAVAEKGKAYESLLTVNVTAIELRLALSLMGYEGVTPNGTDRVLPPPTAQDSVLVTGIVNGKERPISAYLFDKKTKKPPKDHDFQVVGFQSADRDQALLTKDFFSLIARDPFAPLRINTDTGNPYAGPNEGYSGNDKLIKPGQEMTLVLKRRPDKVIVPMPNPLDTNPIPTVPGMPTLPPSP